MSEIITWLVPLISIIGSAVVSGVVGFLVKRYLSRYFEARDAKLAKLAELEKKDDQERLERTIDKKLDPIANRIEALESGVLSTLRNDILTCYYKCLEKGYRNDWDYQNIHHLNEAYVDLNGNSYVADIMKRFDELPTKEEFIKSKKKKSTAKAKSSK